jgi:hypothetical protein
LPSRHQQGCRARLWGSKGGGVTLWGRVEFVTRRLNSSCALMVRCNTRCNTRGAAAVSVPILYLLYTVSLRVCVGRPLNMHSHMHLKYALAGMLLVRYKARAA